MHSVGICGLHQWLVTSHIYFFLPLTSAQSPLPSESEFVAVFFLIKSVISIEKTNFSENLISLPVRINIHKKLKYFMD
jgi:hypothetical protein